MNQLNNQNPNETTKNETNENDTEQQYPYTLVEHPQYASWFDDLVENHQSKVTSWLDGLKLGTRQGTTYYRQLAGFGQHPVYELTIKKSRLAPELRVYTYDKGDTVILLMLGSKKDDQKIITRRLQEGIRKGDYDDYIT